MNTLLFVLTELLRRYLTNLKEKFIAAQHEE